MPRLKSSSRRARVARAISSAYLSLKDVKTADVPKSRRMFDKIAGLAPVAERVQAERRTVAGRSGASMKSRREQDPWFHEDDIALVGRYYCREDELGHPLVSPVFADLHGMPPVHIQVGDDEILLSDATRLADGLRAEGGDVHTEIFDDMWHVFQMFLPFVPESRAALGRLCGAMQEELSKP